MSFLVGNTTCVFVFAFCFFSKCDCISSGTAEALEAYNEAIKWKIIAGKQQSTGLFVSANGDQPFKDEDMCLDWQQICKGASGANKTSLDHVYKTGLRVAL